MSYIYKIYTTIKNKLNILIIKIKDYNHIK